MKKIPLTPQMDELIQELRLIVSNAVVESVYNDAIANVQTLLEDGTSNPWVGQDVDFIIEYFEKWFTFLPLPDNVQIENESESGLGYIEPFTYFYLNNSKAFFFLNNFKSKTQGNKYTTKNINIMNNSVSPDLWGDKWSNPLFYPN